jgi:hypothetical protein
LSAEHSGVLAFESVVVHAKNNSIKKECKKSQSNVTE